METLMLVALPPPSVYDMTTVFAVESVVLVIIPRQLHNPSVLLVNAGEFMAIVALDVREKLDPAQRISTNAKAPASGPGTPPAPHESKYLLSPADAVLKGIDPTCVSVMIEPAADAAA
jgi:hypothetical protein